LGLSLALFALPALATDYYVSRNKGRGKKATKEKPAKDLGNIIHKLKAGDTVHIAQGLYKGRGKNGHYKIEVPVRIIGGYDETFAKRDPWGAHKTILSGDSFSENASDQPRLIVELHMKHKSRAGNTHHVLIDGLIIDNQQRNQYLAGGKMIARIFNKKTRQRQSPGTPGIRVTASPYVNITIQNTVIANVASKSGALVVSGGKATKVTIKNNLIVNNTGDGIVMLSGFKAGHLRHMKKYLPTFAVLNNTVLFAWKIALLDEAVGNGLMTDNDLTAVVKGNVFGFCDLYGVNNIRVMKGTPLTVANNLFAGNHWNDYKEAKAAMKVDDIEDESQHLTDKSEGNVRGKIKVAAPKEWAKLYMSRSHKRRSQITGNVKAARTRANQLRGILGLPKQAGTVKSDVKFWLHPLKTDEAVKLGLSRYQKKFGCKKP